jgi:hypothetical protein
MDLPTTGDLSHEDDRARIAQEDIVSGDDVKRLKRRQPWDPS